MSEIDSRVSTGAMQMDEILNGGFPVNSINVIMGEPGTGKTVFAQQMVFHNAKNERPIVYLTTLSEPAAKVLTYLQRFKFYDEELVGPVVHYYEIGSELSSNGLDALLDRVRETIHTLNPHMIFVDSFKALHEITDNPRAMRRMLYDLTGLLTAYDTTVFLVGEYTESEAKVLPEFAIADGIVQFFRKSFSTRDERFVRVLKLRGSGYMEGLHGFKINHNGIQVYPRLVTPEVTANYPTSDTRASTGIAGLDDIVGGGFLQGSTTMVAGPSGSGKTTLAVHFCLNGIARDEKCAYVCFQENPSQLGRLTQSLGQSMESLLNGGFFLQYSSPVELQIDSIIVKLFNCIVENNIKRLVIDSIGDLARAAGDVERLHDYLYSLIQHCAAKGVTSVMTYETPGALMNMLSPTGIGPFSNMSDNIVLLSMPKEPDYNREIHCIKARNSQHELRPQRFVISESGISLVEH